MELVAVYGSLREGLSNHDLLGNSKKVGDDIIGGWIMRSLTSFPYIHPSSRGDSDTIHIEVYEVEEDQMKILDRLEGYPAFYDRKVVETKYGEAWIYFIDKVGEQVVVKNGDWKEFKVCQ